MHSNIDLWQSRKEMDALQRLQGRADIVAGTALAAPAASMLTVPCACDLQQGRELSVLRSPLPYPNPIHGTTLKPSHFYRELFEPMHTDARAVSEALRGMLAPADIQPHIYVFACPL